ncbi:LLM class flavin-dependent oxidoreductase, partial [Bradyrhizobium sp.]|uniref:LLM class flavin-dependent oxidoreductase n=1 Tax=Bradyrhizobium sp. TaxID=376 RepID=UPI00290A8289
MPRTPKTIAVNGFAIFSPVHLSPGLWRHPDDRSLEFDTLRYWTDVARTLEAGRFDSIFIADGIGIHDVYAGNADAALSTAAQIPKLDPMLLVSAMAAVTEHLGLGITASVSYEPPFTLARRFSTLDHLTRGRIAWNIVTGYSAAASRAVGRADIMAHDPRYDLADEFLDAVYALWEGSWDDGAVIADRDRGVFADPSRIRKVHHQGQHFKVDAIHLVHPSPQRTPFLFQAGASHRGKDFAARHAEAVFLGEHSKTRTAANVAETRARAQAFGRNANDIRFFGLITVIVGETRAEAEAKYRDYQRYTDPKGALALLSGWTGIDFGQYQPDQVLKHLHTNAIQSAVETFSSADPSREWTVQGIAEWVGIGGFGPLLVGGPQTVADELQAWVEETDVDGFNLAYAVTHETFTDVVELLVPELQKRGAYKRDYTAGTLREKLFNQGP